MKREELIKRESITDDQGVDDMLEYLSETNDPTYTVTKLLEELAELSEVLLKNMNKRPERRPSPEHINEEIGDVLMRIYLYIDQNKIDEEIINQRVTDKCNKFLGYIKNSEYSKGI